MLWTIIAIVVSGLGSAGIALVLRNLSRNKLPKWIIPVFAGAGMLAYQIYYEYSWYEHQQPRQPESAVIVSSETGQVFWRPWTFHYPMIIAFTVIDTDNIARTQIDNAYLAEFILYRFEKQHIDTVKHQTYILNCNSREMLPFDHNAQPLLHQMKRLGQDEVLYMTACPAEYQP